jgi:Kdo2-lipid IVA lauroyltransferase/acyltransferase
MAPPSSPLGLWGQYVAARLAVAALTCFDADSTLPAAAAMGRLVYRLDRRHRQRAVANLRIAYPTLDDAAIHVLARRSFEHFSQLVAEVFHAPRMLHAESWSARITLGNLQEPIRLLNAGKPLILLTGHLGNWEVLGGLLAVLGFPIAAVARPLDNRLVNDWLLGVRERRGLAVITKWNATERMLEVLDGGGALGFIADQNAGDRGLYVPFFGRLASTYKSIGLLALSREVPIVCGYARRVGPGCRYELGVVDAIHPDDWAGRRDPLYYVTARYIRAIEIMVRASPEQYLWMHRRWKSRPAFEREGRPLPASLRRNLEDLPWMDQPTLDRMTQPLPA